LYKRVTLSFAPEVSLWSETEAILWPRKCTGFLPPVIELPASWISCSSLRSPFGHNPATEFSGVVYEADNVPLAGVTVELTFRKLRLPQTTGSDGRFLFCCLPEGQFEIVFHHRLASTAGEFTLTLARTRPSHVIAELRTGSAKEWQLREDASYGDVQDTSTRTYTQVNIARLPSALHLWAFLGHTEVSATVERFDVAGMHADDACCLVRAAVPGRKTEWSGMGSM
jgi:hypothetical protein